MIWDKDKLPDALFSKTAIKEFLTEWQDNHYFGQLTGSSPSSIVRLFNIEQGRRAEFPKQMRNNITVVSEGEQVSGSEDKLVYDTDELNAVLSTIAKGNNMAIYTRQAYEHDYLQDLNKQLLVDRQLIDERRWLYANIYGLLPKERPNAGHIIKISGSEFDEIGELEKLKDLIPTIHLTNTFKTDAEHQISRARVVFGEDELEPLAEDTIEDAKGKMTATGLTVNGIRAVERVARVGRPTDSIKETRIAPYTVDSALKWGRRPLRYLLLTSFNAYQFMANHDPIFISQFSRGVMENSNQPSILRGGDYKGSIEGVDVVIEHGLDRLTIQDDDGNLFALNILLGGSAFGYASGYHKLVKKIDTDYDTVYGIAHHEVSDLKMLSYKSSIYKDKIIKEGDSILKIPEGALFWFVKIPPVKKTTRSLNALDAVKDTVSTLTNTKK